MHAPRPADLAGGLAAAAAQDAHVGAAQPQPVRDDHLVDGVIGQAAQAEHEHPRPADRRRRGRDRRTEPLERAQRADPVQEGAFDGQAQRRGDAVGDAELAARVRAAQRREPLVDPLERVHLDGPGARPDGGTQGRDERAARIALQPEAQERRQ